MSKKFAEIGKDLDTYFDDLADFLERLGERVEKLEEKVFPDGRPGPDRPPPPPGTEPGG